MKFDDVREIGLKLPEAEATRYHRRPALTAEPLADSLPDGPDEVEQTRPRSGLAWPFFS